MRLELTALDNPDLIGKLIAARRTLARESEATGRQVEREVRNLRSQVEGDRIGRARIGGLGEFGAQINPAVLNGVSARHVALKDALELIDQVLEGEILEEEDDGDEYEDDDDDDVVAYH